MEPQVKRSRTDTLAWVDNATKQVAGLAHAHWFETDEALESVPRQAFTFLVPRDTDTYVFRYADGSPDVDGAGCDACSAAWDMQFGAQVQHGWVGREHFDYIVTRSHDDGPLDIEARLVSTPLQLATTLLEHNILVDQLSE